MKRNNKLKTFWVSDYEICAAKNASEAFKVALEEWGMTKKNG